MSARFDAAASTQRHELTPASACALPLADRSLLNLLLLPRPSAAC
jgi:hypothetical protein